MADNYLEYHREEYERKKAEYLLRKKRKPRADAKACAPTPAANAEKMLSFPIAKINLGLNVVAKRPDGYHDLETVFYPVPISDALEIAPMAGGFPSEYACDLKITGASIEGDEQRNLVVKAYNMLAEEHKGQLPRLHIHLHKAIPTQAGMGGGSSDGAFMLRMLNQAFALGLDEEAMTQRAARLGADCPFFITCRPAYAEGIGERLEPIDLSLAGWHLAIVRPPIPVSTREAFSLITPRPTAKKCRDIVAQPVETWRESLTNDFEQSVFSLHPEIDAIKQRLYQLGAAYASMTGSGSSVYGLFREKTDLDAYPEGWFSTWVDL